ncbi:peptide ABC transporter substrate-binding protein [Sporichthya polymorpha]|uniref:peptide ABC transporter substrate-binding protein n=1 Tax=Sporichthya polymorpha TaxID=35751 RepID=UPI0003A63D97|nr:ABC transporter substrate-binding protein [Sporichthya polymorpha]
MRRMMRSRRFAGLAAGMSAVLALSACSDGGGSGAEGDDDTITVRGCTPSFPLTPAATSSTCGLNILNAVTARLVHYASNGEARTDLAESISTDDAKTWTVRIRENATFSDGTPVTAASFVDAWNYAAYGPNNSPNANLFSPIVGYESVHPLDPDGEEGLGQAPPPSSTQLSGLTIADDRTFTIALREADATFPQRLGLVAFAPLPASFFTDAGQEFSEEPIGAGPFTLSEWDHGDRIVLEAWDDYSGPSRAKVKNVIFKMYDNSEAAYNDVVANTLDVTDVIPAGAREDERYQDDLDDRWVASPYGQIQVLRFPDEDEDRTYRSERLKRAISMALDRSELVKLAPGEFLVPATGWTPPGVAGYEENRCGRTCLYDRDDARDERNRAGGYDGTIRITYDAETPTVSNPSMWTEVCRQIERALNEPCEVTPASAQRFQDLMTDEETDDLLVIDKTMAYPSIDDFLVPMYSRNGVANWVDYRYTRFNDELSRAASRPNLDEAFDTYADAEALLVNDMPSVPLWYTNSLAGFSDRVTGVKLDIFGLYDLTGIAVTR